MKLRSTGLAAATLGLALVFTPAAGASCVSECDLACLWAEYLALAREAADDMARAAHYDQGAAEGYALALDAARRELDSLVPSIQGMIEEGVVGEVCSKLKGNLERVGRAMEAVMGIQGAGVLEAMAKVARRNASWNWRIAKGRLRRYKWCCENRPPASPADPAPPPQPAKPAPKMPPVTTESGKRREPLSHQVLDQIEAARKDYERGKSVSAAELNNRMPKRVLFWKLAAMEGSLGGADFSNVRVHADSAASKASEAMGARAFSTSDQVKFRELSPGSDELLAHELTHVIQQGGAPVERGGTRSRKRPGRAR